MKTTTKSTAAAKDLICSAVAETQAKAPEFIKIMRFARAKAHRDIQNGDKPLHGRLSSDWTSAKRLGHAEAAQTQGAEDSPACLMFALTEETGGTSIRPHTIERDRKAAMKRLQAWEEEPMALQAILNELICPELQIPFGALLAHSQFLEQLADDYEKRLAETGDHDDVILEDYRRALADADAVLWLVATIAGEGEEQEAA
jgi:hypothetical protein